MSNPLPQARLQTPSSELSPATTASAALAETAAVQRSSVCEHAVPVSQESPLPRHVAIIMDGNGRWATGRGMPRLEGHRKGVEAAQRVVEAAYERGLDYLTLYSFSTENWRRPQAEVSGLMQLFRLYVENNLKKLHKNNVRIQMIGGRERLEKDIVKWVSHAEALTAGNTGLTLTIAFNYGSRQELLEAAQGLLGELERGEVCREKVGHEDFERHLQTASMPHPDLLIRTSGEQRFSNYLMWQSVDAVVRFTDVLWPDFGREALEESLDYFAQQRAR